MAEVYTYDGTHLVTVTDDSVGLTQGAHLGQVETGQFTIEDIPGTLSIVGQKDFSVTQSSCSFPLTFRGFIADRSYGRLEGTPKVTTTREIQVSLEDLNSMLGHLLIHVQGSMTKAQGGKRPAETVAARGAWLMASPFVDFADNGRCDFPADKGMDAADYRYRHAGDVLADMALAAQGYNYHVNDWGAGPELTFRDDNASTADSSTLRISNVLADASGVTLNPAQDWVLRRSPAKVVSKLADQYSKGTVVEERAATAAAFNGERSGTVSNSAIKTAAAATLDAEAQLSQLSTEEDILDGTLDAVTSAQVNLILQGMRIQVKFSHFANTGGRNYDTFTWCRVLERTVTPIVADGALYTMHLKLSPQEAGTAEGAIVQSAFGRGTHFGYIHILPNPVTIGSILVAVIGEKAGDGDPEAPNVTAGLPRFGAGGWTRFNGSTLTRASAISTPQNACSAYWKVADSTEQECYFTTNGGVVGVWELPSTFDPASANVEYEDLTAGGTTYTIGTVGSPAAGDITLAIWCLGTVGTVSDWSWDYQNSYPWQTPDPNPNIDASMTLRYSKWAGGDGYSQNAFLPGTPWIVIADALGDGSACSATVTPGQSGHVFGALAITIPPL